ncbi:MAG: hypothetical protein AB8G05_19825 [Oligoflexales bacterium]
MDDTMREAAIDYIKSWASSSVRPTRNSEQVRKYIARANNHDILVACAYVRRFKGFPHETKFHLIEEKLDEDDLKAAKEFLQGHDDTEDELLELGLVIDLNSQQSTVQPPC